MRFGFLMGSPKWSFEEVYLITQLGTNYDENSARVQSCKASVVQPMCRIASGLNRFVAGDVQVVELPFKCVEADYSSNWGSWCTQGMEDKEIANPTPSLPPTVHIKFQCSVTFKIVSNHNKINRTCKKLQQLWALLMEKTTGNCFI